MYKNGKSYRILWILVQLFSFSQLLAQKPTTFVSNLQFNNQYIFQNLADFQDKNTPQFDYFLPLNQQTVLFHNNGFSWYSVNKKDTSIITIRFRNANPSAKIEALDPVKHYFTFDTLKQKFIGYQQLIYHNLYPNIDWIVSINPDSPQAFKYTWRLRPGANINHIQYQSNNAKFKLSADQKSLYSYEQSDTLLDGQLKIFNQSGKPIMGNFIANQNFIGFQILSPIARNDTIFIDPWVSKISFQAILQPLDLHKDLFMSQLQRSLPTKQMERHL